MFEQPLAPVGGSLAFSALVAALPLLLLFVLLGAFKVKAWVAALAGHPTLGYLCPGPGAAGAATWSAWRRRC